MSEEFRKASDVVKALFEGFDQSGMEKATSFFRSWKEIVGEKVSAHAKVIDVDRGNVIVEVDHPGWSQQILFRKKQILYSLSRNYPDLCIQNIIIRVVSDCKTPYIRQNNSVGTGIHRIQEKDINETEKYEIDDSSLNEDLKIIFEKLKESIRKGKPQD